MRLAPSFLGLLSVAVVAASCATGNVAPPPDDDGGTTPPADSGPCTSMCSGKCADLKTDTANCGKCGTVCPMGATCVAGNCQCGMADGGSTQTKCGMTCVDTKTDATNCGKCGTICGNDAGAILGGGTWGCTNGVCSIVCPMGKTECGGVCLDTKTDNDNCGSCGNACVAMTEQCTEGLCCKLGQKVCKDADGGAPTCTDTNTDALNCGMCGTVCPMNKPSCSAGMCSTLYTFSGVKTNFPDNLLAGWSLCYKDTFDKTGISLASTVLSQCSQANLMLACRATNTTTIIVAAHAPRADVLFDTGTTNTPHNANGTGWYYNSQYSWGFAQLNDPLSRSSCDVNSTNPQFRLCFHTFNPGVLGYGYRCGSLTGLNGSVAYERLIYQAP